MLRGFGGLCVHVLDFFTLGFCLLLLLGFGEGGGGGVCVFERRGETIFKAFIFTTGID